MAIAITALIVLAAGAPIPDAEQAQDPVSAQVTVVDAIQYRALLARQRLVYDVAEAPQVYLAPGDTWTNCIVRYLVPLRQRRRWSTDMLVAISIELAKPEHHGRIIPGYRPQREPHQALNALAFGIHEKKVNWVLDADIRGFFDEID